MSEIKQKSIDNDNGIEAIGDDELEAVSGGITQDEFNTIKEVEQKARPKGFTVMLANGEVLDSVCSCRYYYKWAYEKHPSTSPGRFNYYAVKCYQCGAFYQALKVDE